MVANAQDVVSRVLRQRRKKMTPTVAKQLLTWRFSRADLKYFSQLLEKNSESTISPDESRELQSFVLMGEMLDLLHSEAEVVLHRRKSKTAA